MKVESKSAAGFGRVVADGKFFRCGGEKFYVKGVTYGPFAPSRENGTYPPRLQAERDMTQLRELGANLIRVYYVPPKWFLDLALRHGLKVLVDVPWPKHVCFLESYEVQEAAKQAVREAVTACDRHPAVFAFSVVNEIPAEVVRWSGVRAMEEFIDELIAEAKQIDPGCLCTFASYPPTEYLHSRRADFCLFNVYLHQQPSLEAYLARLQSIADTRPLVMGEFGIDTLREGEAKQAEVLGWQIETVFRGGLAGTVVFSFTDDWFRGGRQIDDWAFGLTTWDRKPKPAFAVVKERFAKAPFFPRGRMPKVSVVVASYNGGKTLRVCLESLTHLNYPDYEVILVDDGSTDDTKAIARDFPRVRAIHQSNQGLSVARNVGITASTGEVVAFTDSDCRADEDWLRFLINDLLASPDAVAVGGHNFLPPEDSAVAAVVLAAPGGPAHVMLNDREAEHVPGCNMAFYKWALESINGFDPIFRRAGDDVDVCWRLLERGHKISFSPGGFVWHYRRSTVKAYLKQQAGYGEAEALLAVKHPEYFNTLGGGIWHGRIYSCSSAGLVLKQPIIYHGQFGGGFFQRIYAAPPALSLMFTTSLEYQLIINGGLLTLVGWFPSLLPVLALTLLMPVVVSVVSATQASLPITKEKPWSRALLALLFLLQPIVRGWERYQGRFTLRTQPINRLPGTKAARRAEVHGGVLALGYWGREPVDRYLFIRKIFESFGALNWQNKADSGWTAHDVELAGSRWVRVQVTTASEELGQGRQFYRCRLKARWSPLAKVSFWGFALVLFAVIAKLAESEPWLWMALLAIPSIGLVLDYLADSQLSTGRDVIETIAEELRFERFAPPALDDEKPTPTT